MNSQANAGALRYALEWLAVLASAATVSAAPLTVYVDVGAAPGGTGGSADPFQTIGAGVAAIVANAGVGQFEGTVRVADGLYRATANGGLENFGTNGIVIGKYMTIRGGYAGSGDWTEGTRVVRSSDIDLTGANTRAFYQNTGVTHVYNGSLIDGFTMRNANTAGDGGAIGMTGGFGVGMSVANCSFTNNRASGNGGAVYLNGSWGPASTTNCTFADNQAGASGGGAYIYGAEKYGQGVFDSILLRNRAGVSGGGAVVQGGSGSGAEPKAERNVFLGNTAVNQGGALFTPDCDSGVAALLINLSTFIGNSAPEGAAIGGRDYWNGSYDIRNSLIAKNTGGYAVEADGWRTSGENILDMSYVTIADNPGGGVYVNWNYGTTAGLRVQDSIVANNGANGIRYNPGTGGPVSSITYSDVFGQTTNFGGSAAAGTGTISLDPQFVDALNNIYQLLATSPARDTGIDLGIYTDLLNKIRPYPIGPTPGYDMGAFEFPEPTALSLAFLAGAWFLRRRQAAA